MQEILEQMVRIDSNNYVSNYYYKHNYISILDTNLVNDFRFYDISTKKIVSVVSFRNPIFFIFDINKKRYITKNLRFAADFEIDLFYNRNKKIIEEDKEKKNTLIVKPNFRDDLPEPISSKITEKPKKKEEKTITNQLNLF